MENKKLYETIADIAYIAGNHRYYSGDSRVDISDIIYWSKEFEKKNRFTDWGKHDYMIEIESFANQKIDKERKE